MSYHIVSLKESKAPVWVLGLCDGPIVSAMGPHDHLREVRQIQDPRIVRCPDFLNYTTPGNQSVHLSRAARLVWLRNACARCVPFSTRQN